MVDAAKLKNDLYAPLLKYHQKSGTDYFGKDVVDTAAATKDAGLLVGEIMIRPNIKKLLDALDKPAGNSAPHKDSAKLTEAIIAKWKTPEGSQFLSNLEKDLGADKDVTAKLVSAIQKDPNKVAQNISSYKAGNLAAAIPAESVKTAPSGTAPAPKEAKAEPEIVPARTQAIKKAASAAPVSPIEATASAAIESNETVAKAPKSPKTEPAASAEDKAITDKILQTAFESLADRSDTEIANAIDADMVKSIAKGMSQQAISKYGVQEPAAKAFLKKIAGPQEPGESKDGYDPQLADNIAANLKRNPEFVRQLAKAAKNKEPMDKAMVDMARPTMTSVMENPEKLADDKYVKDLSQKMNMGSSMGGFGKILNNIFGEGFGSKISGWFNAIFSQIKSWISGFTGDKQVISMKSGGNGSFLPTVMVNLDAINANRDAAAAQARYSPLTMTALSQKGADGKFFHDEQVKDKDGKPAVSQDGKPVMKTVMNGAYTITDIDGKQHSVMPSVGQLEAKQDKDGNVYGRFVTKINANGVSDELATIRVSEAEFKKYEEATNKRAREAGLNQTLAFSAYTAQDAANAAKAQTIQMVSVDPKTSAVSPVTAVNIATPQEPSVGYTVVNGTVMRKPEPAKNDPEFALRGNG